MATFNQRNITEFRSRLAGGGARANLFEVEIAFPEELGINLTDISDKVPFLVKAAEIPASNLGNIPVPYRGRVLPVAGDRTFDPWTVTIINDTDFVIRDAMEKWSNSINDLQTAQGTINPEVYQKSALVKQLSREGGAETVENRPADLTLGRRGPETRSDDDAASHPQRKRRKQNEHEASSPQASLRNSHPLASS